MVQKTASHEQLVKLAKIFLDDKTIPMDKDTLETLVEGVFLPGGLLSRFFGKYQFREDQMRMALVAARAIATGRSAILEAGTGTGKSFGELFPTIIFAALQGKRVLVVTHTIALQQQLFSKDIPLVQNVLKDIGIEFSAAQLKGKGNYVCVKKFEKTLEENNPYYQKEMDLFVNEATTEDGCLILGDKEKLTYKPDDIFWSKISADQNCDCSQCPYAQNGCFYKHVKDKAKSADVIIGNHFVLMADLVARIKAGFKEGSGVLPDYDLLVIDESHHIEDVASDFLGRKISHASVKRFLNKVRVAFGKNGPMKDYAQDKRFEILNRCNDVESLSKDIFANVEKVTKEEKSSSIFWDKPLSNDLSAFAYLEEKLMFAQVREKDEEKKNLLGRLVNDINNLRTDFEYVNSLSEDEYFVYWTSQESGEMVIKVTPIAVNKYLREGLFERMPVVLTSATLSFDSGLSMFARKIGKLEPHEYETICVDSPFDYEKSVCFYIPQDAEEPDSQTYDEYCMREMVRLVKMCKGRAFLLFTSNATMEKYHSIIGKEIENMGYPTLVQGQKDRTQLINDFKELKNAVLFGADSFWEGIDVPGRELSLVVVQKLPFSVPTPVTNARRVEIRKNGGNDFLEAAVFPAIIKYKQGFGRLIRHEFDKGVFSVLDARMITHKEKYGQYFFKAMPSCIKKTVYAEDLVPYFE